MLIIIRLVLGLNEVKCLVYYEMCDCTYMQFHSANEPSKNLDIRVRVLFSSLRGRVLFGSARVLALFDFRVRVTFGSWQNLGSGTVRSCWVRVLAHL